MKWHVREFSDRSSWSFTGSDPMILPGGLPIRESFFRWVDPLNTNCQLFYPPTAGLSSAIFTNPPVSAHRFLFIRWLILNPSYCRLLSPGPCHQQFRPSWELQAL